jgi:hypothetical protein
MSKNYEMTGSGAIYGVVLRFALKD